MSTVIRSFFLLVVVAIVGIAFMYGPPSRAGARNRQEHTPLYQNCDKTFGYRG
jgi:hypothetical protein